MKDEVISKLPEKTDATERIPPRVSHGHVVAPWRATRRRGRTGSFETSSDSLQIPGAEGKSKVVDWKTLDTLRLRWKRQKKVVVWTNGCFDLLHVGHIRNLQAARQHGDVLVVGLNSDASTLRIKGPKRPVVPEQERAEVLAALACVDYVVIFDEDTPKVALARLKPDIHCKGADYAPPNGKPIPEAPVVESYGGRIAFIPLVPGVSTTDLVQRILKKTGFNNTDLQSKQY